MTDYNAEAEAGSFAIAMSLTAQEEGNIEAALSRAYEAGAEEADDAIHDFLTSLGVPTSERFPETALDGSHARIKTLVAMTTAAERERVRPLVEAAQQLDGATDGFDPRWISATKSDGALGALHGFRDALRAYTTDEQGEL